jgi:lauroyl/myristoyl acyltransferase
LAQRAGCPVIPLGPVREGNMNRIILGEPIVITRQNRDEAIAMVSKFFEDRIKEHPDHWLMFLNEYETKRMVAGK